MNEKKKTREQVLELLRAVVLLVDALARLWS